MQSAESSQLTLLLSTAVQLERIAAEQNEISTRDAARELTQKIERNQFHLVVVGQFKRGKTSVLNALLGEMVLPVAVLPLTSVVTILRYGTIAHGTVLFHSGGNRDIQIEQLQEYVTEAGNPHNRKGVAHVEVFYPSEYLKGGATLIDTPGIASVYAHNTQATYDFVPKIDAAIFVTSPEPPLTATEVEFLADLMRHVKKIYVVMNKTDVVRAAELAEVLQFSKQALPAELGDQGRIFAVSAREALQAKSTGDRGLLEQSGFGELEAELNRFLREEKGRVLTDAVQRGLLRLIADLRMYLSLQIQATQMPVEELRGKISDFNAELESAREQSEDNDLLLKGGVVKLVAMFKEEARRFAESEADALSAAAELWFEQQRALSRRKLASAFDQFLAGEIQTRFDHWRTEYDGHAVARFREITERFQTRVNELIRQVRETAGSLFGVEIGHFDGAEELALLEPSGYHIDPLLDWGLGNAPLLLPGPLYQSYLLRAMLKKVPSEMERNATRVAYDFGRRLDKSIAEFRRAMNGKLGETIQSIQRVIQTALGRHEAGSAEADNAVRMLSAAIREVEDLGERVRGVSIEPNRSVEV